MTEDKIVEVAAGLIFSKGRLLIAQRKKSDHLGGLWEFPGGKLEPGENYPDCLRRELTEELGVETAVGPLLCAVEHAYSDKTVRIKFHQCRLITGKPQPLGCAALEWVSAAELANYEFPPADQQILNIIRDREDLWQADKDS